CARDTHRVLRGDSGNGADAVNAVRGKRLQVGLNAGARARIAAGDGERNAHGYRPRTIKYWKGRFSRRSTRKPAARASASTALPSTRTPSFGAGPGPPCPGL